MSVWYKVYDKKIKKFEVLSETKYFVTYQNPFWSAPQREAKGCDWFPTFQAAKLYLIENASKRLDAAKRNVIYYTAEVEKFNQEVEKFNQLEETDEQAQKD